MEENPWSISVNVTEDENDYKKEHPIESVPILNQQLSDNGCVTSTDFNKTVNNLGSIITDVVAGDDTARERPEFRSLNFPAIKAAIDWLIKTNQMSESGKIDLMTNAWRLNFKANPPTPEEFLTDKYIGAQAETLHKPLRDIFCEFLNPLKPYRTMGLTQCIGWGKAQPYSSKVGIDYDCEGNMIYKNIGDLKIGDTVIVPVSKKIKAHILNINELGEQDTYKITLSDGRSFRTHLNHYSVVCFRKDIAGDVWDTVTTQYMINNPQYHYTFMTDDSYEDISWNDFVKMIVCNKKEPTTVEEPIIKEGPYVVKIEKDIRENCRCISISNPEGLYYTDEGIITHNSTLSTLVQLYISVHYALMWHPYRFFGLSPSTIFSQCLGGWNQKKASELLLEPFIQILECSPYFKRVRTHTDLVEASAEEAAECLHWTTSTPTSQPLDELIIMSDGTKKCMGDISIGDKIKSPTEGESIVINIPFEGEADCYEIELEDGRKVRCSKEHLWKVRKNENSDWEVVPLEYIMNNPQYDWEIIEDSDF